MHSYEMCILTKYINKKLPIHNYQPDSDYYVFQFWTFIIYNVPYKVSNCDFVTLVFANNNVQ